MNEVGKSILLFTLDDTIQKKRQTVEMPYVIRKLKRELDQSNSLSVVT